MTAPELIWAVQADANGLVRRWDEHYIGGHRYILTDLHDATKVQLAECEARLRKVVEALKSLIQHAHNCEKELTEELHHTDFCGESLPLTNARAVLAEIEKVGV